jgi:hypothetical protein
MLIKKKKGMGIEDMWMLIYRLVFLVAALFVFVMIVNMILDPFPDVHEAKTEIILGRVLYSEAIHYNNPDINRVYSNIVDVDKLNLLQTQNKLEKYFSEEFYHPIRNNLLVFKLDILVLDDDNSREPIIFYSSESQYNLLLPKRKMKGKGGVTAKTRTFETHCKIDSNFIPCRITLDLLIPNS